MEYRAEPAFGIEHRDPQFFRLTRLRVLDHGANIFRPTIRIVRWPKRPDERGPAAASAKRDALVIAMHLVKAGGARRDIDERFAVHVDENAFGCHNDGSTLFVPTGIAIARRARAAESDIIHAMLDSFLVEARL